MSFQTAIWFGWAILVAYLWRLVLAQWVFRRRNLWDVFRSYLLMILLGFAGLWASDLLGFKLYGYDPNDPLERLGWFILFYSPVGLPLLFGIPFMIAAEFIWALLPKSVKDWT